MAKNRIEKRKAHIPLINMWSSKIIMLVKIPRNLLDLQNALNVVAN